MPRTEYYLVNPLIGGNMQTTFKGKNSIDAAKNAYNSLSQYFNNNVPEFYFTLQEIKSKKTLVGGGVNNDYKHFKVVENKSDKQVNFRISPYDVKGNTKQLKQFKEQIQKLNKQQLGGSTQSGGKKIKYDKDDSSDSDDWLDDDEDHYFPKMSSSTILSNPLSLWYYDPYVFRIQQYYIPTFVAPVAPYISIPLYL